MVILWLLCLSNCIFTTVLSGYYHIGCYEQLHDLSNFKCTNSQDCYQNCKSNGSKYFGLQGGSSTQQTCYCFNESPLQSSSPSPKCKTKTNNGHGTNTAIDLYKIEDKWIVFGHEFTSKSNETDSQTVVSHNYIVKTEGFYNQNIDTPIPYIGLDINGTLTNKNDPNPIWDQSVYFKPYPQTDYVEFYLTIWNDHVLEGDAFFIIDSNTNCGWTKVKSEVVNHNNKSGDHQCGYIYYSVFNPKVHNCYGNIYSNDPSPLEIE